MGLAMSLVTSAIEPPCAARSLFPRPRSRKTLGELLSELPPRGNPHWLGNETHQTTSSEWGHGNREQSLEKGRGGFAILLSSLPLILGVKQILGTGQSYIQIVENSLGAVH